jgi:putative endonuclease
VFLDANYRWQRGELDLVMRDGVTVVFVEVRQRSSSQFGGAASSIDRQKVARVRMTARHWAVRRLDRQDTPMRIDAVLVQGRRGACTITHLEAVG